MNSTTQDDIENRCEACFGTGQKIEVHPVRFGQKLAPYVACPACKGTGQKQQAT